MFSKLWFKNNLIRLKIRTDKLLCQIYVASCPIGMIAKKEKKTSTIFSTIKILKVRRFYSVSNLELLRRLFWNLCHEFFLHKQSYKTYIFKKSN